MSESERIYTMDDNKRLTVINLLSGPSVGKSTVAPKLMGLMKEQQYKVEFVAEFAKGLVWDRRKMQSFCDQDYIFANQHNEIRRLVAHDIDYVVFDSSLLLGLLYMPEWYPKTFKPFLLEVYNSYNNINIFLERNPAFAYVEAGRNQTFEESLQKDKEVLDFLNKENIPYHSVMSSNSAHQEILDIVKKLS